MLVNIIDNTLTKIENPLPLYQLIAQYTAKIIDRPTFTARVKEMDIQTKRQIKQWRRWSDGSFYYQRLWRAVIKGKSFFSRYQVEREDIHWVTSYLSDEDKKSLRKIRKEQLVPIKRFKKHIFEALLLDLKKFCSKLVSYKCWFICKYDAGTTLEDITAEILEHATTAVLRYEPLYDRKKVLGYAKKAAHNRVINLIKEATAKKRARVINEGSATNEYRSLVVSYDKCHDIITSEDLNQTLTRLGVTDPDHDNFARAILGLCPSFDVWLKNWAKKDVLKLSVKEVGELAKEWLGIDSIDQNLGKLLI